MRMYLYEDARERLADANDVGDTMRGRVVAVDEPRRTARAVTYEKHEAFFDLRA